MTDGRCPPQSQGYRMDYRFRSIVPADLPLLRQWRSRPHVIEWWGNPELEPEDLKASDPNIAMWIVEAGERPFAFAQDYDPHAWVDHHFSHLPPGSRGIDQYIGEPNMLDGGHGTHFVRQHVHHLLETGSPAIGTDPHPENGRARRCYEKVGFTTMTGPVRTLWGTAILMEKWN